MISLIVPVYNVEKYLHSCLDSIIEQTYKDYEVILVDDGSPDWCGQICDEYVRCNDKFAVIHGENAGQSGARNAGLVIARGEYICFIDSDDTIDSNYLLWMYNSIINIESDIVICGYQAVNNKKDIRICQVQTVKRLNEDGIRQEVFGKLNNSACNKLYRRELIADLLFPVGIYHGEDLLFNINYLSKCKYGILLKAPLYHYWRRSGSITRGSFSERKLLEITVKDLAKIYIEVYRPQMIEVVENYCFRARMNVLSSIYKSKNEKAYAKEVEIYTGYIKRNYKQLSNSLRIKERVEYYIFTSCRPAYKVLHCAMR